MSASPGQAARGSGEGWDKFSDACPRSSGPRPASPARRSSPGPSYLSMYFSPVPQKPLSVLHRPAHPMLSQRHVENIDIQYEKDKAAAERHANAFRRNAGQRWHHNGPGTPTILEQGHIIDRGRGKGVDQRIHGLFDPILSEFRIPPAEGTTQRPVRPSSAPHTRNARAGHRVDQQIQDTRGVRNPITGSIKPGFEPDPQYEERNRREFERQNGGVRAGIASRGLVCGPYNPITGHPLYELATPAPSSPAPGQVAAAGSRVRPQSAPRERGPAGSLSVTLWDRPGTSSKRTIQNGETWGSYNPITHTWAVPPQDPRYHHPSAQLEKERGITGSHVGRVALPANQGVYNPIQNRWDVPPANMRIAAGLSFAPATLFSRPAPHTIRAQH